MSSPLRDELASLRIERRPRGGRPAGPRERGAPTRRRGDGMMRLTSWLLWLIPMLVLAGAGLVAYREYDKVRSQPELFVGLVERMTSGEAEKLLTAKGYLKSRFQAMVGAKVVGRVERMYVEEGARVKKGDLLARLEQNDLIAQLESRTAQKARIEAELDEARSELWEKEREAKRADRLFQQKTMMAEDADKAQTERKKAAARVAALVAAVDLMKANVDEINATINSMSLHAPFDGTVVAKQGEEGEIVSPSGGGSGRTAVITIADLERMEVETDVTESLLSRLEVGQPAAVEVFAIPSKRYHGRLRQVIPMGNRAEGTVKVKVEITDPDPRLFPDLAAKVHFLPLRTSETDDAGQSRVFVPKAAVLEERGQEYVWVLGSRNSLRKRSVETAATKEALARVLSGLEPGEKVVLNPPPTLHENQTIRVSE